MCRTLGSREKTQVELGVHVRQGMIIINIYYLLRYISTLYTYYFIQ